MNEELQKAIDEITKEMLADGKEPWEINAVIQKYLASKGVYGDKTDQDDNVAKEQPKKEQQISDEQALINQNTLENQDWWNNNADLGNVGDYTQNEAGNWVNSAGEVVLYKEDPWASGSLNPADVNNIISPGDGTSYVWRGLASGERSKELADQLEKQKSEREFIQSVTESSSEIEKDSLEVKAKETNRRAQKFFADNEDIVRSDWEYIGDGVIRNTSN